MKKSSKKGEKKKQDLWLSLLHHGLQNLVDKLYSRILKNNGNKLLYISLYKWILLLEWYVKNLDILVYTNWY